MTMKTPVSILQEIMVKKSMTPNYELIHDGGGSHMNTFTYKVTCDGFTATGTGRCKKDAKHEAAKSMLETIAAHRAYPQLPASPAQSPVRTPVPPTIPASPRLPPNIPFKNAIGALQDLCCENNLQEPKYNLISDVGPPHDRRFTFQCIVATFKEQGIATTKKQAKHEAAQKMLDRIMDLLTLKGKDELCCVSQIEENRRKEILANEIAIARYPELSKLSSAKKTNLGLRICEYDAALAMSCDNNIRKDVLSRLKTLKHNHESIITHEKFEISTEEIVSDLSHILSLMSLSVECAEVESDEIFVIAIIINSCPTITQFGSGKTKIEAECFAILEALNTMIFFLS